MITTPRGKRKAAFPLSRPVPQTPESKKLMNCLDLPFEEVCQLFEMLSDPRRRASDKAGLWYRYLSRFVKSCNLYPLLRLVVPQLDRERNSYNIKEIKLSKLYTEILGLPEEESDRLKHFKDPSKLQHILAHAGDYGSVLYAVLKKRLEVSPTLTVEGINILLDTFHNASDGEARRIAFSSLVRQATAYQQKWISRILLQDLKIGIGRDRLLRGYHSDCVHLYNECSDLKTVCERIIYRQNAPLETPVHTSSPLSQEGISCFWPFKPMLAQRINLNDVKKLFLLKEGEETPPEYFLETKYDGERILCHYKSEEKKVMFFSRRGTNYSYYYLPQLESSIKTHIKGKMAILDGEMMAWDDHFKVFLPFGANRAVAQMDSNEKKNLCYIIFDILLYQSNEGDLLTLLDVPLIERKKLLAESIHSIPHKFEIANFKSVKTARDVISHLKTIMEQHGEGLVLKHWSSLYTLNARTAGWFKLKPEYGELSETLDLIAIGGYFGDSQKRRDPFSESLADHCSRFLLGVLEEDAKEKETPHVISFCKVGTGYSEQELNEIRRYIKPFCFPYKDITSAPWLNDWNFPASERPDIIWKPQNGFIMEVKATNIIPSSNFETLCTLRFPRAVQSFRKDKEWWESWTLSILTDFMKDLQNVQKNDSQDEWEKYPFSSPFSFSSSSTISPYKIQKVEEIFKEETKGLPSPRKIYRRPLTIESSPTVYTVISSLFESFEFLVMNGDLQTSKLKIETLILVNGGNLTQAYRPSFTHFVLAAKKTFRVTTLVTNYSISVLHYQWLMDSIAQNHICAFHPKYEIYFPLEWKMHFATFYDIYGDSFFEEIKTVKEMKEICAHIPIKNETSHEINQKNIEILEGEHMEAVEERNEEKQLLNTIFHTSFNIFWGMQLYLHSCFSNEISVFQETFSKLLENSEKQHQISILQQFRLFGGRITEHVEEATHILCHPSTSENTVKDKPHITIAYLEKCLKEIKFSDAVP